MKEYFCEELSEYWDLVPNTINSNSFEILNNGEPYIIENENGEPVTGLFNEGNSNKFLKICNNTQYLVNDSLIHPYRMIPLLVLNFNSKKYIGSGFFVSPRCILTCAHNLFPFNPLNKYVDKVDVIPCYSSLNNSAPLGFSSSSYLYVPDKWKQAVKNSVYAIEYDLGVIVLPDSTLYQKVGSFFKLNVLHKSGKIFNAGFREADHALWGSSGLTKISTSKTSLLYDADTETGHSGSPLFNLMEGSFTSFGIHTNGTCPNQGIAITNNIISFVNKITNIYEANV